MKNIKWEELSDVISVAAPLLGALLLTPAAPFIGALIASKAECAATPDDIFKSLDGELSVVVGMEIEDRFKYESMVVEAARQNAGKVEINNSRMPMVVVVLVGFIAVVEIALWGVK